MTAEKLKSLTLRELQVLDRVAEGKTSPEIATKLRISNESIRFYLKRLRDKLGERRKTVIAISAAGHREVIRQLIKEKRESR